MKLDKCPMCRQPVWDLSGDPRFVRPDARGPLPGVSGEDQQDHDEKVARERRFKNKKKKSN